MVRLTPVLMLASAALLGGALLLPAAQADGVSDTCSGGKGVTATLGGEAYPVCVRNVSQCSWNESGASLDYGVGTLSVCQGNSDGCPYLTARAGNVDFTGPHVLPLSVCGPFACGSDIGAGAGVGDTGSACVGASQCGPGGVGVEPAYQGSPVVVYLGTTTDCIDQQYAEDTAGSAARLVLVLAGGAVDQVQQIVDELGIIVDPGVFPTLCSPGPADADNGWGVTGGPLGPSCLGVWFRLDQGCSGIIRQGATVGVGGVTSSIGNSVSVCV